MALHEVEADPGLVFWITGLPRSGKTTLAGAVAKALRGRGTAVVEVDGDAVRAAFGGDLGYDDQDRLVNARRISGLCKLLSDQGLTVVCSTVSLFHEIHDLNRATLSRYVEVMLETSPETLRRRDPALYEAAHTGTALLPGVNQACERPRTPSIVFESQDSDLGLEQAVAVLLTYVAPPS